MDSTIREWLRSDGKNDRVGLPIAPSVGNATNTNTIQIDFVRFCAPSFAPPQPPMVNDFTKQDPNFPSPCDQLLEGLRIHVLERAYVILLHMGDSRSWLRPNAKEAVPARTDEKGNLIAISEAEFDSDVPAKRHAVPLAPLGRYAYFWTFDKDIFKDVWSKLQADLRPTLANHPFYTFSLGTTARNNPEADKLIPPNPRRPELRKLASFVLFRVNDGVAAGSALRELSVKGYIDDEVRYVVGRSDALATFYLVELAHRLGLGIRASSLDEWKTILQARDLSTYATEKRRHPEFDAALPESDGSRPKHWFFTDFNNDYHEYAYRAAKAAARQVDRETFQASLDMRVGNDGWVNAAGKIFEDTEKTKEPVKHPSLEFDEFHNLRWKPPPDRGAGVLRYFDLYRYGFDVAGMFQKREVILRAPSIIGSLCADIRSLLRTLLETRSPYQRFMQELGAHTLNSAHDRKRLHASYVRAAMATGCRWWEHFSTDSQNGATTGRHDRVAVQYHWEDLQRYTAWVSTLGGKIGDLMVVIFGSPNAAFEANNLVSEAVEGFEALMGKMKDYEKCLGSGQLVKVFPSGARMEIDFNRGQLVVAEAEKRPVGQLHFLIEKQARWNESGDPSMQYGKVAVRKANLHGMRIVELEGKGSPFREVHEVPVWLQTFSALVGYAIVLSNISKDLKEQGGVSVFMKVSAGTLQCIASVGDAVRLLGYTRDALPFSRGAAKALSVAEKLGPLGGAIEAFASVREGYVLCFGHPKDKPNEIDEALEKGNTLVASALRAKGVVLLSNAIPGVAGTAAFAGNTAVAAGLVEAESAAGVTATAEALVSFATLWMAATGVLAVAIEIYISAVQGPDDAMADFRAELNRSVRMEFGEEGRSQYHVCRTADGLEGLDRRLTGALALAGFDVLRLGM